MASTIAVSVQRFRVAMGSRRMPSLTDNPTAPAATCSDDDAQADAQLPDGVAHHPGA